jgi:hypothetical protein
MGRVAGNARRLIVFHKGGISMKAYCDSILAEVMENKAKLLEMYGGIEGLDKHQEEERPVYTAPRQRLRTRRIAPPCG